MREITVKFIKLSFITYKLDLGLKHASNCVYFLYSNAKKMISNVFFS